MDRTSIQPAATVGLTARCLLITESVAFGVQDGSTYYMVHTMNLGQLPRLCTSDGLSWTAPTTIIQDGANNPESSLFKDLFQVTIIFIGTGRKADGA